MEHLNAQISYKMDFKGIYLITSQFTSREEAITKLVNGSEFQRQVSELILILLRCLAYKNITVLHT